MNREINKIRTRELFDLALGPYKSFTPIESLKINGRILYEPLSVPKYDKTDITVENIDTISAVLSCQFERILILNMANAEVPGGGYLHGAVAQEEDLFRKTNLFRTLTDNLYPMMDDEIIYSPTVHVLRDSKWKALSVPRTVSFVSMAAICNPQLSEFGMFSYSDYETTYQKIRTIFYVAAFYGFEHLILGALGCGAFRNPPEQVAEIFAKVLKEFNGCFRTVKFAVLSLGDNPNYTIFREILLGD